MASYHDQPPAGQRQQEKLRAKHVEQMLRQADEAERKMEQELEAVVHARAVAVRKLDARHAEMLDGHATAQQQALKLLRLLHEDQILVEIHNAIAELLERSRNSCSLALGPFQTDHSTEFRIELPLHQYQESNHSKTHANLFTNQNEERDVPQPPCKSEQ